MGISGVYTDVNAWQCKADEKFGIKGAQIDLMLVRKDQIINLCEMKYTESAFSVTGKFILDMNEKIKSLREKSKTNYAIHPTLVTTYPVARNEYAGDLFEVILLNWFVKFRSS